MSKGIHGAGLKASFHPGGEDYLQHSTMTRNIELGVKGRLLNALHDKYGVCSHCGKGSCAGKQSGSILNDHDLLNIKMVLNLINEVIPD